MANSTITSASQIQMDYMKLLVTQLQNQNPLEPMDNDQMASQLAQFSSLQQLESMNSSFAQVLAITNRNYANSLLDKNVTFYTEDASTGEYVNKSGTVTSVFYDVSTGQTLLGVTAGEGEEAEEYTLGLGAVVLTENQK
ncbi:MAG: flagellar hook capping FlgD N-terminal domain-containing protein [Phycisphaerae bacterium]|nr:flagellar hook capping FlgD N-terminal domain-containing protein [Phycisphaerae bacterium]